MRNLTRLAQAPSPSDLAAEIALDALNMAFERPRPAPGLIHNSDRGIQYADVA